MMIVYCVFIPTQCRNLCVEVNQRQQLSRQERYHRIQTSVETPLPSPSIPQSLSQSQKTGSWTYKSQASILWPQGNQNRGFFLCSHTHYPEYQIQTSRRSHLCPLFSYYYWSSTLLLYHRRFSLSLSPSHSTARDNTIPKLIHHLSLRSDSNQ